MRQALYLVLSAGSLLAQSSSTPPAALVQIEHWADTCPDSDPVTKQILTDFGIRLDGAPLTSSPA